MRPYLWEIEFDDGTVYRQMLDGRNPFDPQDPPADLGTPRLIRALAIAPGYPVVTVTIPSGARPVFHFLKMGTLGGGPDRCTAVRVGYNQAGQRTMKVVNLRTREVTDMQDDKGRN